MANNIAATRVTEPVVLVLGLTGSGKTSFINQITGSSFGVGNGSNKCTIRPNHAFTLIDGIKVAFVDIPGFSEPNIKPSDTLREVQRWIDCRLDSPRKVTAALYFNDITKVDSGFAPAQNYNIFFELLGSSDMRNLGLVSTKWDAAVLSVAKDNEAFLVAKPWYLLLQHKPRIYRLDGQRDTAINMVEDLLRAQRSFREILEASRRKKGKAISRKQAGLNFMWSNGLHLVSFVLNSVRIGLDFVDFWNFLRARKDADAPITFSTPTLFARLKNFWGWN